jgi:phage shock protein PspC (stress-responsive transcriptional regulator)
MTAQKPHYRDTSNKKLGGVCAGIANYFDLDPTLVRLAAVVIAICAGSGLLIYIVMWIVIPEAPDSV